MIEKYYISSSRSLFDYSQVLYITLFYFLRGVIFLFTIVFLFIKAYFYNNSKLVEKQTMNEIMTKCQESFYATPIWVKKYFSRISDQNDSIVKKFKIFKSLVKSGNNSYANANSNTNN